LPKDKAVGNQKENVIKLDNNINNIEFKTNPINIQTSVEIIHDSYSANCVDNSFIVFNSIYHILYLVYKWINQTN